MRRARHHRKAVEEQGFLRQLGACKCRPGRPYDEVDVGLAQLVQQGVVGAVNDGDGQPGVGLQHAVHRPGQQAPGGKRQRADDQASLHDATLRGQRVAGLLQLGPGQLESLLGGLASLGQAQALARTHEQCRTGHVLQLGQRLVHGRLADAQCCRAGGL
ncbi:hypothetical protein FQZ97_893410 [compost metagenome]